jgi:hypothetical protein
MINSDIHQEVVIILGTHKLVLSLLIIIIIIIIIICGPGV